MSPTTADLDATWLILQFHDIWAEKETPRILNFLTLSVSLESSTSFFATLTVLFVRQANNFCQHWEQFRSLKPGFHAERRAFLSTFPIDSSRHSVPRSITVDPSEEFLFLSSVGQVLRQINSAVWSAVFREELNPSKSHSRLRAFWTKQHVHKQSLKKEICLQISESMMRQVLLAWDVPNGTFEVRRALFMENVSILVRHVSMVRKKDNESRKHRKRYIHRFLFPCPWENKVMFWCF